MRKLRLIESHMFTSLIILSSSDCQEKNKKDTQRHGIVRESKSMVNAKVLKGVELS
jgi:hypothetical protein